MHEEIPLTREAVAKLEKLLAAVKAAQAQLQAFLHGYLAARGIEEGLVEQIDLAGQKLIIRRQSDEAGTARDHPDGSGIAMG